MRRSMLFAALAATLAASAAAEAQLSYSYVSVNYVDNEADTALGEHDGAGPEFIVSFDILPFLHVFGGAKQIELDDFPLETRTLHAGAGVHWDMDERRSVFFNLAAVDVEVDVSTGLGAIGGDDDGYAYSIGYREANERGLEFTVSADHIELSDSDYGDTSLRMSLQFPVKQRFKIEGTVNFAGDDTFWALGARYYFANPLLR